MDNTFKDFKELLDIVLKANQVELFDFNFNSLMVGDLMEDPIILTFNRERLIRVIDSNSAIVPSTYNMCASLLALKENRELRDKLVQTVENILTIYREDTILYDKDIIAQMFNVKQKDIKSLSEDSFHIGIFLYYIAILQNLTKETE